MRFFDGARSRNRTPIHEYLGMLLSFKPDVWSEEAQFLAHAQPGYGWAPALSLLGAVGLLIIAVADTIARDGAAAADILFWAGLILLFLPITARLAVLRISQRERLILVGVLGLGLALVKVLHSPIELTFSDEFPHWHTVDTILQTQHLFGFNSLQPIQGLYIGMASLTAALVSLSGLSIFTCGVLLIVVARMVLVFALYLLYERVSGSPRMASLGLALYCTNPPYVFWSSQFAYESLALPLSILVVLALIQRSEKHAASFGLSLTLVLGLFVIVMTHHMTTYMLVGFIGLWLLVSLWHRKPTAEITRIAAFIFVVSSTWMLYIASLTVRYLAPVLANTLVDFGRLIVGDIVSRELFRSPGGQIASIWERGIGIGSVALILLLLPGGIFWIWRCYRRNTIILALGIASLCYPLLLALRFTQVGAEISNRSSEFLFLALAFVLAVCLDRVVLTRAGWWRPAVAATLITAIFCGGVVIGLAPWARMPGPYMVGGDTRGLQPESELAAGWMLRELGPANRLISDRTNQITMGTYGNQTIVIGLSWIFFEPELSVSKLNALQQKGVRFIVVDRRLSAAVPRTGVYFERGEPNGLHHLQPIDAAALAKFDTTFGLRRVFDSGNLVIYDANVLLGGK